MIKQISVFVSILVTVVISGVTSVHAYAEPGSFLDTESLSVNGEAWTFKTLAPSEKKVVETHPRLMITQENIPNIREKISDSVYSNDIVELEKQADQGDVLANAFLYAVFGDESRGAVAKEKLLQGNYGDYAGYEAAAEWLVPVLVFDWIFPLLSESEKTEAFQLLKANFNYDHELIDEPETAWYWNDEWARHRPLYYPALAFAIYGDGIDDAWAEDVINLAYSDSRYALGPYSTDTSSGFLDVLMTLSLDDGGGDQASGSNEHIGSGYYAMFLHSMLPLSIWESATGQEMWKRSLFFQKIPVYWSYSAKSAPDTTGLATLEYITGIYKDIDPESASLAKHLIDKYGRGNYHSVFRLIHGDLRVQAKSPEELGIATTQYLKGADLFTSRTNWDDTDSVVLSVYSRYLDTSRYEPYSGVYGLYKNGQPLLVRGTATKTNAKPGVYSGLWIYDPEKGLKGQGSTYWTGFGNYDQQGRAYEAYSPVTKAYYFPGGPDFWEATPDYRAITQEYSRLMTASPVYTTRNTIVHIPDGDREFVVVYDYANVGENLTVAPSMRLATTPIIDGNEFSIDGMNVTVTSPENSELTWVGGLNNELRTPEPELAWYGNSRGGYTPGYSSDPEMTTAAGLGNVYIHPKVLSGEYDFLSVIEVSDLPPLVVTKISEREVKFGKWGVTFSPTGAYVVSKNGEIVGDSTDYINNNIRSDANNANPIDDNTSDDSVSTLDTGVIIDFGYSSSSSLLGDGWVTILMDRYTRYSSTTMGYTGTAIDVGNNGAYNYQGVKGSIKPFSANDSVNITWYNNSNSVVSFSPRISFVDADRVTIGEAVNWYMLDEVSIEPYSVGVSKFIFDAATAGEYDTVNVNMNYNNTQVLFCDKIEYEKALTDEFFVSSPDDGLIIDFGNSPSSNVSGDGWNQVLRDRYTEYFVTGGYAGTTIDRGNNGSYNYQGVKGCLKSFSVNDSVDITWYNNSDSIVSFSPFISFDDPDRVCSGGSGSWYLLDEVSIEPHGVGVSKFTFDTATAGEYDTVNINMNYDNTKEIVCDKIEYKAFN